MTLIETQTLESTWGLRARQKLPDDLTLKEYADLTHAVDDLCVGAGSPESRLERAQYGSDFLLALSVAASASAVLVSLSVTLKNLAEARKLNAEAEAARAENRLCKLRQAAAEAEAEARRAEQAKKLGHNPDPALIEIVRELGDRSDDLSRQIGSAEMRAHEARRLSYGLRGMNYALRSMHPQSSPSPSLYEEVAASLAQTSPALSARIRLNAANETEAAADSDADRLVRAINLLASYDIEIDIERT